MTHARIPEQTTDWLTKQFESLLTDRREMTRHGWQIPVAIYGTCGLVLGVAFRSDMKPIELAVVFFLSSYLAMGGLFSLQRLHSRRGYRRYEIRRVAQWFAKEFDETRLTKLDDVEWKPPNYTEGDRWPVDVAPSSDTITDYNRRCMNGKLERILGLYSTTAVGMSLMIILYGVLLFGGFSQLLVVVRDKFPGVASVVVSASVSVGIVFLSLVSLAILCGVGHASDSDC